MDSQAVFGNRNNASPLLELLTGKTVDTDSQTASCLDHLSSLSLQDLLREPSVLSSEASLLTTELTNLCHREYPTFLQVHSTAKTLSTSFESLSTSLTSLVSAIPDLDTACRTFTLTSRPILAERSKAALVLNTHEKLLDILEIPQLIDTCIRSGSYQEAMDLANHATGLVKRFPDIAIIRSIEKEVEQAVRMMLVQLLALLREPVKLPVLFKAVNFLRKMGDWKQEEIAVIFLASRTTNLEWIFASLERERIDAARYLRKFVDAFREGVTDVINHFTSIFIEQSSLDSVGTLRQLLATFSHQQIALLLEKLEEYLPQIEDPTSLTSLLTLLTYCSQSLARLGLDFRPLLVEPFSAAVLSAARKSLDGAASAFKGAISEAEKNQKLPSTWILATGTSQQYAIPDIPHQLDSKLPIQSPPHILATFPPIARFLNSLLVAYNTIRLLPPSHLLDEVHDILLETLQTACEALFAYSKAYATPSNSRRSLDADGKDKKSREVAVLVAAGKVVVRILVPYSRRALVEGVFGSSLERLETSTELDQVIEGWGAWIVENTPQHLNGLRENGQAAADS